jgi:hypothetical protein
LCWPDVSLLNEFRSEEVKLLLFKFRFKIFINFTLDTLRDLKAPPCTLAEREREKGREGKKERGERRERVREFKK